MKKLSILVSALALTFCLTSVQAQTPQAPAKKTTTKEVAPVKKEETKETKTTTKKTTTKKTEKPAAKAEQKKS
ncbi:MAG: hypothetical protein WCK02_06115 [Bacteroidota bacterium]